jgi:histidinol-phosphate aminotransferase
VKPLLPTHGGSDDGPPIIHDFSSNSNPLGPPPRLWRAVQEADRRHYPDPKYVALRHHLAAAHHVAPEQILPAAGGSEAIRRLTLAARLQGLRAVWVPQPGFGDYALAAQALGLTVHRYASFAEIGGDAPSLVWICEPNNPTGASAPVLDPRELPTGSIVAVDLAYAPLRLRGEAPAIAPACWQLHCPNKALGLTGVRAAYLISPSQEDECWAQMQSLAASWVLSAEGQAMLTHWHEVETGDWLTTSRAELRQWTVEQRAMLAALGWQQGASCTPFWLARPAKPLPDLRAHGIKLRDASSFGLAGWVRIATQPPLSQEALLKALTR